MAKEKKTSASDSLLNANTKPTQNKLFYGDNLDVLPKIPSDSIDLCYIDPPFNSKRNYFQIYNNIGREDFAQAQAFVDTWEWGDLAEKGYSLLTDDWFYSGKVTEKTKYLIQGLFPVLGRGALMAYIISLTSRIIEIHRVLKPTGSFYLHCDPTASHYLKLILDSIFLSERRGGHFCNEIIWCYRGGGVPKKDFARRHDIIFRYAKSENYTFNVDSVRIPYSQDSVERLKYKAKAFRGEKTYDNYEPNINGKHPEDWWEMQPVMPSAKERLGYPTQKPEALLERIIKASSNEGDVVLDAYCGCGTTVAVAQRLNRNWIGVDITYQSISLILKRLQDRYPDAWPNIEANLLLDGVPRDMASAKALANRKDDRTRKEFEKWALLTYSKNQARINEKKGADGGIDGVAYFMIDKDVHGKVIFQVKSGGANRATIATLNSDRQREKAEIGILITMDKPTKPMLEEARLVGKYTHPLLSREDDRLKIITIEEILDGARLDLPMGRIDIVKSATAISDKDKQIALSLEDDHDYDDEAED